MKFSEQWLREWVNPPVTTAELAERLTMAGLEVESVTEAAPAFDGVVIGKVLALAPHPNADKLRVCEVDVGEGQPLQIVCGAANVHVGMFAPTARVGAYLPGDVRIRRAKLRGVESEGMLCSAQELGLAESAAGLMDLPADARPGQSLRNYLGLDDNVIEVDLTPNRGDCLGILGIAREVGVLNRCQVNPPVMEAVPSSISDVFPIQVAAPEACPRYLGRVVRGVNALAETPLWMRERLRRSGIRSLGPLVDVTNYVLLELGQPMHAFDLAQLKGAIHVRWAQPGEVLKLLDGQEVALDTETLVIADKSRALAMAGVMGGEASGVSDATCDVFLECAYFMPETIAGRARRYGLHTDSSHRFERGVDFEIQQQAMERASQLLIAIAGGEVGPVTEVASSEHLPQRPPIRLRRQRVRRLLGLEIPDQEIEEILDRLGMQVAPEQEGWFVTAPSFRFDITIEVDLIEELGRVYGYSRLPSTRPLSALAMTGVPEAGVSLDRVRQVLVDRGYQEAITYSFVDPELQHLLDPEQEPVALANPITSEMAVMRTTLWPGLVKTLIHNRNRQQERVRQFETGLRFLQGDADIRQEATIAGLVAGSAYSEQWGEPSREVDFYDVKADLEALFALTGDAAKAFSFEPGEHPALHPGQCALIRSGDQPVGWLGALHPDLKRKLDVGGAVYLFELGFNALLQGAVPRFAELSKFPAIRRDLAIIVDESMDSARVQGKIEEAAGELLQAVTLFDVYRGKGVDLGRKSLALGLILQDSSRTLTESDVETVMYRVVSCLQDELGATLRD